MIIELDGQVAAIDLVNLMFAIEATWGQRPLLGACLNAVFLSVDTDSAEARHLSEKRANRPLPSDLLGKAMKTTAH